MKVSNQVGGIQVRFLVPIPKVNYVISDRDLPSTSGKQLEAVTIANKVFGVSWTTLTHNSKEGFSYLVYRSVRLSTAHGSSIVSSAEKKIFKLYMYIYISTYMYYCMYL